MWTISQTHNLCRIFSYQLWTPSILFNWIKSFIAYPFPLLELDNGNQQSNKMINYR